MIYFFMEDMYMNEFNTIDKVKSLFESFGMNGNQNSYFIGYVKAPTKLLYLVALWEEWLPECKQHRKINVVLI